MDIKEAQRLVENHATIRRLAERLGLENPDGVADALTSSMTGSVTREEAEERVRALVFRDPGVVKVWNGWHAHEIRAVHASLVAENRGDDAERFYRTHRAAIEKRDVFTFSRRAGF